MKLHTRLLHVGSGLIVIVALGLFVSSCGGASPSAPTAPPASRIIVSDAPSGAGASLSGTTTTWGCLTAGSAGVFASATGCPAAGITASSQWRVAALAAPSPSANLSGSVNGSTVALNWLAPTSSDPATSYIVEAGSSSGATDIAVFDTGSAATTLTVTSVPAGTYFVRVRARNSAGSSAPSNEIMLTVGGGTTPCPTAPGAPSGLSAATSGTSLTLTWSAPVGGCPPTTYVIEAGSTSGASNLASISTNSTSPSFAASSVPAGTYFVRVRAGTSSGTGAASNEVVVTIGNETPGSVTGRWVGLVANGDGTTLNSSDCGLEKADWQLDLTQTGSNVTGTLTQMTRLSGCGGVGQVQVASLAGTAGSGTFSFTISNNPSRTASATFTASRMTGSTTFAGTFAVNKQ